MRQEVLIISEAMPFPAFVRIFIDLFGKDIEFFNTCDRILKAIGLYGSGGLRAIGFISLIMKYRHVSDE